MSLLRGLKSNLVCNLPRGKTQPTTQAPHASHPPPPVGRLTKVRLRPAGLPPPPIAVRQIQTLRPDPPTHVARRLGRPTQPAFEIIQGAGIGSFLILDPHPTTIAGALSHGRFD